MYSFAKKIPDHIFLQKRGKKCKKKENSPLWSTKQDSGEILSFTKFLWDLIYFKMDICEIKMNLYSHVKIV
jgi:hypothetical protein